MELGLYPKLTKDYILKRITQEQIMEFYLSIPVTTGTLIRSPLRNDKTPTCSFYYNNQGRLRFRDHSGHFWGDCFDVVARGLSVDVSNKKAFVLILHTIAKDFRIHKYENSEAVSLYKKQTDYFFKIQKHKKPIKIRIVYRTPNYHDDAYWGNININRNLLKKGLVFYAEEIWISKDNLDFKKIYTYQPTDPAYCYYGGKFQDGEFRWKIYFPFRKKRGDNGFISNSAFLQGRHLLTCGRVCIITKSYKDALVFHSLGIHAVAPSAESVLLTKKEYRYIKERYDFVISCMDYGIDNKLDRAGIRMAYNLRKIYNIEPFMFTNGMFNSENFKAKDASDYVSNNNILLLKDKIKKIYDIYKFDFQKLDTEIYNKLKFIK